MNGKFKIGSLSFRDSALMGANVAGELGIPRAVIGRRGIREPKSSGVSNVWDMIDDVDIVMLFMPPYDAARTQSEIDVYELFKDKYPHKVWILILPVCGDGDKMHAVIEDSHKWDAPYMSIYFVMDDDDVRTIATDIVPGVALEFAKQVESITTKEELDELLQRTYPDSKKVREDKSNE